TTVVDEPKSKRRGCPERSSGPIQTYRERAAWLICANRDERPGTSSHRFRNGLFQSFYQERQAGQRRFRKPLGSSSTDQSWLMIVGTGLPSAPTKPVTVSISGLPAADLPSTRVTALLPSYCPSSGIQEPSPSRRSLPVRRNRRGSGIGLEVPEW